MALLTRTNLVLESELDLFQAVESWIAENRPDGLTAENALRAIRYAMIHPSELFRIQAQSPVLARYRDSVRDLLYLSFQFHAASPLTMAKFFNVNCSLFIPRIYLSPDWGSAWIVPDPGRDDHSGTLQTQLGPSGSDSDRRLTWNLLFSPRWPPLNQDFTRTRPGLHTDRARPDRTGPRITVTPATTSPEMAGILFHKTILVLGRHKDQVRVQRVFSFHQSSEENPDFLSLQDLDPESDLLIHGALHLHLVLRPTYQNLIQTRT